MWGWPVLQPREECPGVPGTSEMLTWGLVLQEAAEKPITLICFAKVSSPSSWTNHSQRHPHRIEWGGPREGASSGGQFGFVPLCLPCGLPDHVPGPVLGTHTQELICSCYRQDDHLGADEGTEAQGAPHDKARDK